MPTPEPDYHAYLLRIWRVLGNEGSHWRASLENVQTGELRGFEDIEWLQDYLDTIAGVGGKQGDSRSAPSGTA